MYRRPKFIEELHKIRQEMAAEADYDVILFSERANSGQTPADAENEERTARETKIAKNSPAPSHEIKIRR